MSKNREREKMKNFFLLSWKRKYKFSRQWSQKFEQQKPKTTSFSCSIKSHQKGMYRWLLFFFLLTFPTSDFDFHFPLLKAFFLQIIYLLFLFKFFAEPLFPLVCVLMLKEADSLRKNRPSKMLWKAPSVQKILNVEFLK